MCFILCILAISVFACFCLFVGLDFLKPTSWYNIGKGICLLILIVIGILSNRYCRCPFCGKKFSRYFYWGNPKCRHCGKKLNPPF